MINSFLYKFSNYINNILKSSFRQVFLEDSFLRSYLCTYLKNTPPLLFPSVSYESALLWYCFLVTLTSIFLLPHLPISFIIPIKKTKSIDRKLIENLSLHPCFLFFLCELLLKIISFEFPYYFL